MSKQLAVIGDRRTLTSKWYGKYGRNIDRMCSHNLRLAVWMLFAVK